MKIEIRMLEAEMLVGEIVEEERMKLDIFRKASRKLKKFVVEITGKEID